MPFTPKKTLELIVDSKNHYVAQVKANQRKLMAHIQQVSLSQPAQSGYSCQERAHGRQSHWQVSVYQASDPTIVQTWAGLACFVHVQRQRIEQGKLTQVDAYFMSDLGLSAQAFAQGIRDHWGIENKLHWVKDRGRPCGSLQRGCEPHPPQERGH